tara:strand:+ start:137 stop:748 length:612 start_codon:yes stop_codon:yes gene_type:complete
MFNLHTHCQNENAIVNGYFDGFLGTNKWVSLGIHPWHVPVNWHNIILEFQGYENLVAIGECGLDKLTSTPWSLQKEVFIAQISLAIKIKKPLIIHCVRAYNECEYLLKSANAIAVFHGFNRNKNILLQLLKYKDFYISLGAAVFKESFEETVMVCPLNRMFLETDDAGIEIGKIYNKVGLIKGVTLEELKEQILLNRYKVFGL